MQTTKIVSLTSQLLTIAEALESMRNRYYSSADSARLAPKSYFPELTPKFQHQAEIRRRAYERIKLLYLKKLDEITSIV